MRLFCFLVGSITLIATLTAPVPACGPFFPEAYLADGREREILAMPEGDFLSELKRLAGPPSTKNPNGKWGWAHTIEVDVQDLEKALRDRGMREGAVGETADAYRSMRNRMGSSPEEVKTRDAGGGEASIGGGFDLNPYEGLLSDLPLEFRIYIRGAAAWAGGRRDEAVREWRSLLDLPREERRYRSVWAAFMIGRALMDDRPGEAVTAFQQARFLGDEGYPDPLGLVAEGLGWQARIERNHGQCPAAIRDYYDMFCLGSEGQRYAAHSSLAWTCRDLLAQEGELDASLIEDPVLREVLTAYIVAYHRGGQPTSSGRCREWLDAVRGSGMMIDSRTANRLAWASYAVGDVESAKEWLDAAETVTPYGIWVRAKLSLREGRIDEAVRDLRSIRDRFPTISEADRRDYTTSRASTQLNAELGVLFLGRKEYTAALDAFLRAGYWADAAYVAERVLTVEELEEYIRRHRDDALLTAGDGSPYHYAGDGPASLLDALRSLLSRRFSRLGDWEKARRYCTEAYRPILDEYVNHLEEGRDPANSPRLRAENLYRAAEIAQEHGMELMGTELYPDWAVHGGVYSWWGYLGRDESRDEYLPNLVEGFPAPLMEVLGGSDDERVRVERAAPSPDIRFHYRYTAANLMWEAAELLPDNDVLTAKALYYGGSWLKKKDPQSADRFYKALVNRCRGLEYGQLADRLRWFPENPPG
jgi:tetratricopeptide (TPR) repeat protein